jgi:hypothetical protein
MGLLLGVGHEANSLTVEKNKPVTKIHNEPWIWEDLKITCDKNE